MKRPNLFAVARYLVLALLLISTASCEKTESDDVAFVLVPSKPVVINADLTIAADPITGLGGLTVAHPWFSTGFSIQNGSPQVVTVMGLTLEYTGTKSGSPVTGSFDFAATNLPNGQSYLMSVQPGQTVNTFGNAANGDPNIPIYVGGLPAADSFVYHVKATVTGWFGTFDNPQSRFEKTFYFNTQ